MNENGLVDRHAVQQLCSFKNPIYIERMISIFFLTALDIFMVLQRLDTYCITAPATTQTSWRKRLLPRFMDVTFLKQISVFNSLWHSLSFFSFGLSQKGAKKFAHILICEISYKSILSMYFTAKYQFHTFKYCRHRI